MKVGTRVKIRGPQVWAKVRRAYARGIPAEAVAKRYDVGVKNLYRRASAEGWTRTALAAAADAAAQPVDDEADWEWGEAKPAKPAAAGAPAGPATTADGSVDWEALYNGLGLDQAPDVDAALTFALQRVSLAMVKGDGTEALKLMKAAQALAKLVPPKPEVRPVTMDDLVYSEEGRAMVRKKAENLAYAMVKVPGASGGAHSWWVYDWRARNLGEETAAQDWQDAKFGGWGDRYWWPDGRRKTLEEVQAAERVWDGCVTSS